MAAKGFKLLDAYVAVHGDGSGVIPDTVKDMEGDEPKVRAAGKSFGSSLVKGITGALTAGIKVVATGLVGVTAASTAFGISAFRDAARVQELDIAMQAVAKSAGYAYMDLSDTARAVKANGIEMATAQTLAIQFAQSHLNLADAVKVSRTAQDLAVITGQNSTDVTNQLLDAITSQNTEILRNAGITTSASEMYNVYAASIGTTADQLTDMQKKQALVNGIIADGAKVSGTYEAALGSASKVLRSLPRIGNDILVSLGQPLLDALGGSIVNFYGLAKAVDTALAPGGALAPIIGVIGQHLKTWLAPLDGVILRVTKWVTGLKASPEILDKVSRLLDGLAKNAPGIGALVAGLLAFGGEALPVIGKFLPAVNPIVAGLVALVALDPGLRKVFGGLLDDLKPLLPMVSDVAKLLAGELAKSFQTLVPMLGDLVKEIAPLIPLLGQVLVQALKAVLPLLPALVKLLAAILPVLKPLMPALQAFADIVGIVLSPIEMLLYLLADLASGDFSQIGQQLGDSFGPVPALFTNMVNSAKQAQSFMMGFYQGVANLMNGWLGMQRDVARGIGDVLTWLHDTIIKPVFDAIVTAATITAGVWRWFYLGIVKPVTDLIGSAFKYLYDTFVAPWFAGVQQGVVQTGNAFTWLNDNIIQPVAAAIGLGLGVLGSVFTWLWVNIIQPVTTAIGTAVGVLYTTFIQPALSGIQVGLGILGGAFTWLWVNAIKPSFDLIGKGAQIVGGIIGVAFSAIGGVIRGAFVGVANFVIGIFNTVIGIVDSVIASINSVGKTAKGLTGVDVHINAIPKIPGLAGGGTLTRGGLTLVGERGKELLNLPAGSQVTNATDTSRLLSGQSGGGGGDTYITIEKVEIPADSLKDVQTAIETLKALRHRARKGVSSGASA